MPTYLLWLRKCAGKRKRRSVQILVEVVSGSRWVETLTETWQQSATLKPRLQSKLGRNKQRRDRVGTDEWGLPWMLERVSQMLATQSGELMEEEKRKCDIWSVAAVFLEVWRVFLVRPTVFSRFTASSQMCMPRDSSTSTCPRYCRVEISTETRREREREWVMLWQTFPVVISTEVFIINFRIQWIFKSERSAWCPLGGRRWWFILLINYHFEVKCSSIVPSLFSDSVCRSIEQVECQVAQ